MKQPTIYSIPPSRSFVDALAYGVWHRAGANPLELARYQILLPTRRSCRSLREAFLRLSDGKPSLLPRMTPIGDVDEDELVLSGHMNAETLTDAILALPPAISSLRRQLLLMELVRKGASKPSADQAALLARELGSLIDQVTTERLDLAEIKNLDVGQYAEHWNETLQFLELVTDFWPEILAEEGMYDPVDRRNRLLEAQASEWTANPPSTPVIAAGSTGSIPATADLLKVVSTMEQGMVVLPGLDPHLTDEAWDVLGPTHPQYGLKQLLNIMNVDRPDVREWPESEVETHHASLASRASLLRGALLPSTVTGTLPSMDAIASNALDEVTRIDCADTSREAECIALIMRETLETPGKTAALVTPDRSLARRVASELRRWNVEIDDSAGVPLSRTPAGTFLQLSAEMIASNLAPVPLLAALKHPLASGGLPPVAFRQNARQLELSTLRGPRPDGGFDGLTAALMDLPDGELRSFVAMLGDMASEFSRCLSEPSMSVRSIVCAHLEFAESLAATDTSDGRMRLWSGDDGEALAQFIGELHDSLDEGVIVLPSEYPVLLETLMRGCVVRPRFSNHPRLSILGPLEARLQHADHMILGGLNEGVWPPEPPSSPWMSRPMMMAFGLPVPERRIGLSAHDFAQAFCAKTVTVTRSERTDGVPTVPSRWLRRLENLVSESALAEQFLPDHSWLSLAMALDEPTEITPVQQPTPTPPLEARPRTLSVTRIRTLLRDPYAVYARHILKLRPLDDIDSDPGAAERGTIVHDILDEFIRTYSDQLPEESEAHLIRIGHDHFAKHISHPGVRAFWWPRFERMATWFIENERARQAGGEKPIASEINGEAEFSTSGGTFTLVARADRVNSLPGGGLALIDYKTGQPPTARQASMGLEPQLPLEAAMVKYGSFDGLTADEVRRLTYIKMTGGRTPGEVRDLKLDLPEVIEATWQGVQKLVSDYDDPAMPYLSHVLPLKQNEVGDYDHLARVREWLTTEDEA